MPFNLRTFQDKVENWTEGAWDGELSKICQSYEKLTTQQQKAHSIKQMMELLDRNVEAGTRYTIMEECGRRCIPASVLAKADRLKKNAIDLDDLLSRLNQSHIGGGHLQQDEQVIHASYDRCYCGSVSKTREPISATYCHCSCGWYRQLFESLLNKPVEVELLGSIIQGNECCQFVIRTK
jgi:predicted hydrocarbon binding protein